MFSLLQMAYVVAVRRIFSSWRLELVLFLGMLLAVALMSSGVIFSNLLAEAALRHALNEASAEEANFSIRVFSGQQAPPTPAGRIRHFQNNVTFSDQRVSSRVEEFLAERSRLVETATFFFNGHPQLELDNDIRARGEIKHHSSLTDERVRLVDGPLALRRRRRALGVGGAVGDRGGFTGIGTAPALHRRPDGHHSRCVVRQPA